MSVVALKDSDMASIATDDLRAGMEKPPEDVTHAEGIFAAWDGLDLFWQAWEPEGDPRGVVALMHGYGEHSGRYHHVASMLVRAGYAVMAIDARGHGRSAGVRGHVDDFAEYPRDFDRLIAELQRRWPDTYTVVLGHSYGGLIALHHALVAPGVISTYAVTSPFVGIQVKVPIGKVLLAKAMSRIWGTFTEPTGLSAATLSHDPFIVEQYENDPLNLSTATVRWFTETKAAHKRLRAEASKITAPFLFLVSGPDEVVDAQAAEEVYHALSSREREFELFPDKKHEVLNEEGWPDLVHRILAWYERFRD